MIFPVSTIKQKHRDQLKKTHSLQYSFHDQTHFWVPKMTNFESFDVGLKRTINYIIKANYLKI